MAIAVDAAYKTVYQSAQSSYSFNLAVDGVDRYLTVAVGIMDPSSEAQVSGITFNGVPMTLLVDRTSAGNPFTRSEIWGLLAPATGTHTTAVTLDNPADSLAGAISFTGVDQTTPTESPESATSIGGSISVSVETTVDNGWVVDTITMTDGVVAVGSGQTQRYNVTGSLGAIAGSTEGPQSPTGYVVMEWSEPVPGSIWTMAAIALRPATGGGGGGDLWLGILSGGGHYGPGNLSGGRC